MVFNPERGYYGIMAELADARDLNKKSFSYEKTKMD
jgi:hypothetical protein